MTAKRLTSLTCILAAGLAACGENKNYGEPLEDPNAAQSAMAAVLNAQRMGTMASNDVALSSADGFAGNLNVLAGVKFQAEQPQQDDEEFAAPKRNAARLMLVDEACVTESGTTITYNDCDYSNTVVNGTVSIDLPNIDMDVEFVSVDEDSTQTTEFRANMNVSETAIDGYFDVDLDYSSDEGFGFSGTFDSDFDIVLADGCAVGGELEAHAVVKASGRSESVWVKAEYGPDCETVIVR